MKNTIALSAISAMALTGAVYSEIDSSFHVGYNSTYVWRGQDLGDQMTEYGFDFGGSCDCGLDWAAGIWYANPSDSDLNDELDIYAEVSKDVGIGSVAVGLIHYEFDETAADNTEVYVALGTGFSGIDLGAAVYYIVDGGIGNGIWTEFSADYGHEISDKLAATLGLGLGLQSGADSADSYTNYSASIGFDYAASEEITISPYVAYNTGTGRDLYEGLYGGASVSFNF